MAWARRHEGGPCARREVSGWCCPLPPSCAPQWSLNSAWGRHHLVRRVGSGRPLGNGTPPLLGGRGGWPGDPVLAMGRSEHARVFQAFGA
eukprot:2921809-Alexandrium_andersonii.AAC.1